MRLLENKTAYVLMLFVLLYLGTARAEVVEGACLKINGVDFTATADDLIKTYGLKRYDRQNRYDLCPDDTVDSGKQVFNLSIERYSCQGNCNQPSSSMSGELYSMELMVLENWFTGERHVWDLDTRWKFPDMRIEESDLLDRFNEKYKDLKLDLVRARLDGLLDARSFDEHDLRQLHPKHQRDEFHCLVRGKVRQVLINTKLDELSVSSYANLFFNRYRRQYGVLARDGKEKHCGGLKGKPAISIE